MPNLPALLNQIQEIDFSLFLESLKPALASSICFILTARSVTNYKIHRDFETKEICKVEIPPELKPKYFKVELKEINSKKLKEATLEFASVLESTFPKSSLTNFYNNINELKIKKNPFLFWDADGAYNDLTNEITILFSSALYHELFHMASTIKNTGLVGFHQYFSKKENIGIGLNEGYTDLLTERYFGEKHKIKGVYIYESKIAHNVEMILGKEKMEELYLKADLNRFIEEMKLFAKEEDILEFLVNLDYICVASNVHLITKDSLIAKKILEIQEFLLKTYQTKMKQQFENQMVNQEMYEKQTEEFLNLLKTNNKVGGVKYSIAQDYTIEKDFAIKR